MRAAVVTAGFPREGSSRHLWWMLWLAVITLMLTQLVDAWQRSAPPQVWIFWYLPLLILIPGMLKDRLRTVIWMSFVSLLYFIWAVLRIFAEPDSLRAQIELFAVVALFLSSMLYVRVRARELRASLSPAHPLEE